MPFPFLRLFSCLKFFCRRPCFVFLSLAAIIFIYAGPASSDIPKGDKENREIKPSSPRNKQDAIAAISGSPWPGVIDHLLQRPLSENLTNSSIVSVHINYPSIGNRTVDMDIRAWISDIADAFESHLDGRQLEITEEYPELAMLSIPHDDDLNTESAYRLTQDKPRFELFGNYSISRPSKSAVSITFELWNYAGNNPGNLDIVTLNYNLLNNKRLNFEDIFEKPDIALDLMSRWARKKLSAYLSASGGNKILDTGTMPLVENFSSLTLTQEGICINFQPYQVATGEAGIQKVDMPLAELMPSSPLLALWDK